MKKRGKIEGAGGMEKERQSRETETERERKLEMRIISRYLQLEYLEDSSLATSACTSKNTHTHTHTRSTNTVLINMQQ